MFKRRTAEQEPAIAENPPSIAPADNGIGVPPFKPAPQPGPTTPTPGVTPGTFGSKEPAMARPPFSTPTPNPAGQAGAIPGGMVAPRVSSTQVTRPSREATERRTLVVGRGISVQGMVQDAERLVVEGQMEASMIHATELAVSAGGIFKGEIEVEDAEISGTIDGTVTARGNLVVRGTGVVLGTARCRRLQVEDGGQITGRMEMITEPRARAGEPAALRSSPVSAEA